MKAVYVLAGLLIVLTATGVTWAVLVRIGIPMFRGRKKKREIGK
jgi:hypothetical protein